MEKRSSAFTRPRNREMDTKVCHGGEKISTPLFLNRSRKLFPTETKLKKRVGRRNIPLHILNKNIQTLFSVGALNNQKERKKIFFECERG